MCVILWENKTEVLTEEKKKYESDEVLVKYIAKHYNILRFLRFDKKDNQKPQDYNYNPKKKNNNPHKYIATAIEACLGAMYMEKAVLWEAIIEIVKEWKKIIDASR